MASKVVNSMLSNPRIINGKTLEIPFISEDSLFLSTSISLQSSKFSYKLFSNFRKSREHMAILDALFRKLLFRQTIQNSKLVKTKSEGL